MKQKLQGILIGITVGMLLSGAASFAKSTTALLEAVYSDIKILVDGEQIIPRDAQGNLVEPFICDGTTYLPVRAIGEAVGKTVQWDEENHCVLLTTPKTETVSEEAKAEPTPEPAPKTEQAENTKPEETVSQTPEYQFSSKNILQISGYREDDISGKVSVAWSGEKPDTASFSAKMRCNNGGLGDYVDCNIQLTQATACTDTQIEGYFRVQLNETVKYEKIPGTVTVTKEEIILHTEGYDYHLVASLGEKLYYADFELTSSYGMEAVSFNGEKASGYLTLSFTEDKTEVELSGTVLVGEKKYTFGLDKMKAFSHRQLLGEFTLSCDNETIVRQATGELFDLQTPLGQTLELTIEGFCTLELMMVEFVQ